MHAAIICFCQKMMLNKERTRRRVRVIWFILTIVVVFILVLALLQHRSPVESGGAGTSETKSRQCDVKQPQRKLLGEGSITCPQPYLDVVKGTRNSRGWTAFRKALKEYKKWHKEKLKVLKSDSAESEEVRTMTFTCTKYWCSGLGDQLYRIEFFVLLAIMSDRLFTVYWDEYLTRSTKYLLPNEIDWTYFDETKGMCNVAGNRKKSEHCSRTTFDKPNRWGFGWNKDEFARFSEVLFSSEKHITVTGQIYCNIMFINKDSYLEPGQKITEGFEKLGINDILAGLPENTVRCGHKDVWYNALHSFGVHHFVDIPKMNSGQLLATEPWIDVSHVIFCYLFKFPELLDAEVGKISKSLGLDKKRYLAVHLRTGFKGMHNEEDDASRWFNRNWKFFDDEHVWDCIVAHGFNVADMMLGPSSLVYLSTDTDVAKHRFLSKYGERLKVTNVSLAHSLKSTSRCENQHSYEDPYISMWIDFLLLGRAEFMLHGDSSFSMNAAFFRPVPHLNHVWVMHDEDKNCIASYIGNMSMCISEKGI